MAERGYPSPHPHSFSVSPRPASSPSSPDPEPETRCQLIDELRCALPVTVYMIYHYISDIFSASYIIYCYMIISNTIDLCPHSCTSHPTTSLLNSLFSEAGVHGGQQQRGLRGLAAQAAAPGGRRAPVAGGHGRPAEGLRGGAAEHREKGQREAEAAEGGAGEWRDGMRA